LLLDGLDRHIHEHGQGEARSSADERVPSGSLLEELGIGGNFSGREIFWSSSYFRMGQKGVTYLGRCSQNQHSRRELGKDLEVGWLASPWVARQCKKVDAGFSRPETMQKR